MTAHIYLVGNPNAGKTLFFNLLTGHEAKVANFPGVTIERKCGPLNGNPTIKVTDLPGIYSLEARSKDEQVTTEVITKVIAECAAHDVVVAVVDATQLKKSLYLVSELKQSGRLSAVVLSMADLTNLPAGALAVLARRIGLPVFLVSAAKGIGIDALRTFLAKPVAPPWRDKQNPTAPHRSSINTIQDHHHVVDEWLKGIRTDPSGSSQIAARIDRATLHPVFGPLILVGVFLLLFEALFVGSKPIVSLIDDVKSMASAFVHTLFEHDSLLGSLLADGVIGGVGSVISFVPLIAILFLFLGALEDSGYMARAVFLLHRVMSRVGLSGKAFVPLVSGFSCSIPAILSTRIIESRSERLATILITPLISCSARLPIYGLLIAAAFSQMPLLYGFIDVGALVMVGMYLFGVVLAFVVAAILRRTLVRGKQAPLIMEMPDYRWPRPRSLWLAVKSRVRHFIREAGTVILALTIVLWALFTFPLESPQAKNTVSGSEIVESLPFGDISSSHLEHSYAGQLGHLLEPIIEPLGFNWKIGIGLVASFAAREVFISTFGVIYGLSRADESPSSLSEAMRADINPKTGRPIYSPLVALSLLVFFAVALQCISTVAATRKETGTWRWPLFQLGYLNALAWILSFTVFQGGSALGF